MTEVPAITRHQARLGDLLLSYRRVGIGKPVVLLHGWPQSSRAWTGVMERLAPHYTVIAPDLRGFGQSDRPAAGYDKKTVAADIRALVDHLGFDRVSIAGHDLGSTVVYPFVAQYPEKVDKLVFIEAPALGLSTEPPPFNAWHFGFHAEQDLPEMLTAGREGAYLAHFLRGAYPGAISEVDFAAYVSDFSRLGGMRAGFDHYRAFPTDFADNQAFARAGKITAPVLCIGADGLFGDYTHRVMAQVCTDIRGVVFDQCSHWIPDEQPERLAAAIIDFFSGPSEAVR